MQKAAPKSSVPARKPAKPAAKPAAKPKKRKQPVSDSGSGSDGEFVPSGDAASEEEDAEESAEEDENASEEEEKKAPRASGGAKPRKRAASKPQPVMPKRPRAGGGISGTNGGTSGGTSGGGGSSSLLCSPATAVSGEGPELTVDAAWYGDASEVWGEAGEFVTELAAALVCGRELRLNPHGAAGWYNARFGDAAPGCEKVLAILTISTHPSCSFYETVLSVRYRYGTDDTNPNPNPDPDH